MIYTPSFQKDYSINGMPIVDYMIRFENLNEDIRELSAELGLGDILSLTGVNAKGEFRAKKSLDYRKFFDQQTRDLVLRSCAWEIDNFGHEFEPSAPPKFRPDPDRFDVKAQFMEFFLNSQLLWATSIY